MKPNEKGLLAGEPEPKELLPIEEISDRFTSSGFAFELIRREGDVALFRKTRSGHSRESFEVVVIQRHPAEAICGRDYPQRESMPSSEAWGRSGWTCTDLKSATARFHALVESRQEGHLRPAVTPDSAFSSVDDRNGATIGGRPCAEPAQHPAPDAPIKEDHDERT